MRSRQSVAINIGQTMQIAREFFNKIGRVLLQGILSPLAAERRITDGEREHLYFGRGRTQKAAPN
jgi:hypothetical protein